MSKYFTSIKRLRFVYSVPWPWKFNFLKKLSSLVLVNSFLK